MAKYSTYGLTSKPSTRDLRSNATRGDTTPTRYENQTVRDEELNVSRGDAESAVRSTRPELFYTDAQIRNQVLKGIEGKTDFGKSSRSKYISTEVNRILNSNKYARKELVDKEYGKLQTKARHDLSVIRSRSTPNTDPINQGSTIDIKSMQGVDADTARYLNYLDLSARVAMKQNPELYEGFENYVSYAQSLANMNPDEREAELSALREEANDIVDPYFDTLEQRVKDDLKTTMSQLNEQFGLFKEGEKYQLDQKIDALTRDAAENLSANFMDMRRRGVMDSGIARTIADKIIEGKQRGEDFENAISELRTREQTMRVDQTKDRAETQSERTLEDIGTERGSQQQQMFFGLLGEEESRAFLQQGATSSTLKNYGPETGAPNSPSSPLGRISTARGLPTSTTPSGSSLDLARRAQSGEINLDQQRTMRNDLLMGKTTVTQPTKTTVTTTPTTSKTPSSTSTKQATTPAGKRLLEYSARRRADRLSGR